MTLVFVYGTLRAGQSNHSLLASSRLIGHGQTIERLRLLNIGAFPAVVRRAPEVRVVGEVYEVDPMTLKRLDRLEGVPHLYQRCERMIELDDGKQILSSIYEWARDDSDSYPSIPSGDWVANK